MKFSEEVAVHNMRTREQLLITVCTLPARKRRENVIMRTA